MNKEFWKKFGSVTGIIVGVLVGLIVVLCVVQAIRMLGSVGMSYVDVWKNWSAFFPKKVSNISEVEDVIVSTVKSFQDVIFSIF